MLLVWPVSFADAGDEQIRMRNLYDAFGHAESSADRAATLNWGFSAYIEFRGKRILFDAGNDAEVFAHNAHDSASISPRSTW